MLISRGADQLDVDVNRVRDLLHTAFQQIGYAQLIANFTQIIRCAFVFPGRSARNDFQRRDFRQAREDFILNTLGKVGIRFVVAQVFEGKHGNALGRFAG